PSHGRPGAAAEDTAGACRHGMRRALRLGAVVLASWPANRVRDAPQGSVPTSPSGGNMNMRRILTVRSGLVVAAVLAVVAVAGCGEGAPAPTEASQAQGLSESQSQLPPFNF